MQLNSATRTSPVLWSRCVRLP